MLMSVLNQGRVFSAESLLGTPVETRWRCPRECLMWMERVRSSSLAQRVWEWRHLTCTLCVLPSWAEVGPSVPKCWCGELGKFFISAPLPSSQEHKQGNKFTGRIPLESCLIYDVWDSVFKGTRVWVRALFCKLYPISYFRPEALWAWQLKGPLASQHG